MPFLYHFFFATHVVFSNTKSGFVFIACFFVLFCVLHFGSDFRREHYLVALRSITPETRNDDGTRKQEYQVKITANITAVNDGRKVTNLKTRVQQILKTRLHFVKTY